MAEQDVELPPKTTDAGTLARLLLETSAPNDSGYDRVESLRAMRLMRRVVENRLAAPGRYRAEGAEDE